MLGIILIYFIGKQFYTLAEDFNKNKWLYAILSVVIYYVAGFIFGTILAVLDLIFEWGIDWDNNFGLNLLGIPIGLLADWGFYYMLKKKWEQSTVLIKDEIQNIGKNTED
ncbi:hypothetical protein ACFO5O_03000 [Geojedonia litorea]|uniref:Uncharacterized protein n=1 Tax=Geojedonia litorea TaxID=1268269 RepID=A0ABV9MZ40_9FLAO